jgi:hypothetical protein
MAGLLSGSEVVVVRFDGGYFVGGYGDVGRVGSAG